jgi:hypothetical protein
MEGDVMKFLGLVAVSVTVVLSTAALAQARPAFRCNGGFEGKTYDNVVVPRGGACTLTGSRVKGNVRALKGSYFQATDTVVRGDVEGRAAQTIFVDGSRVHGSVESDRAVQFFVFNSTVAEDIEPERTRQDVQICGNTLRRGNIEVRRSGPGTGGAPADWPGTDILIGDPLTEACRGNVVKRGDIVVTRNFADIEFVIRGNSVKRGDLLVTSNTGPVTRIVEGNVGGDRLVCRKNTLRLTAADNKRWDRKRGQCA